MNEVAKILGIFAIVSGIIIGVFLGIGLYYGFLLKVVLCLAGLTAVVFVILFMWQYNQSYIVGTRKRTKAALESAFSWATLPYRGLFAPVILLVDWINKLIQDK